MAIALLAACVGYYVWRVESRIAALVAQEVGTVTTTWVSGGQTRECTTLREAGESLPHWQDRHFAAVKVAQAQFPPD
jgi:hypothetical protein